MKVGDTVRGKNAPEVEGEIIKTATRSQFPAEYLLHVDEGIEDYWYYESELELVAEGETKEQVFKELLQEWYSLEKDGETTAMLQSGEVQQEKQEWQKRYEGAL